MPETDEERIARIELHGTFTQTNPLIKDKLALVYKQDLDWLISKLRGLSSPERAAPILPPGFAACSDCPPFGYPTDKTRCVGCPRATPSNPQVRPEQADAQQDGAADNSGEGEL